MTKRFVITVDVKFDVAATVRALALIFLLIAS
jgi:hypothetical protein